MQDKLTPRQVRAWSLCALSVPAAMALPGCGWLWVLGGSILACALAACQQAGLCHLTDDRLTLTPRGMLVQNSILTEVF